MLSFWISGLILRFSVWVRNNLLYVCRSTILYVVCLYFFRFCCFLLKRRLRRVLCRSRMLCGASLGVSVPCFAFCFDLTCLFFIDSAIVGGREKKCRNDASVIPLFHERQFIFCGLMQKKKNLTELVMLIRTSCEGDDFSSALLRSEFISWRERGLALVLSAEINDVVPEL